MFSKVTCAHLVGIDPVKVDVEVDIGAIGLPVFNVVGLAEGAVKESRERVRAALKNLGYNIFAQPITINLAPADIRKDGSHYDLPIAIALLAALDPESYQLESTMIVGELSLDGAVRGVSGVLPIAVRAGELGYKRLIVPKANENEALLVPNIDIYAVEHISEAVVMLRGEGEIPKSVYTAPTTDASNSSYTADFSEVRGQLVAKRAAEIAAAGMHNMIMIGSPGSGKTMIAKCIPSILPKMSLDEALLTTKIHSVAGLLKEKGDLISTRPFIAPHHTASNVAIVGGGSKALPGHVSIATNGVLFLDEILEFNRAVLEVLRQPLEDGYVTIARAGRTVTYPANFMLVAACNPCPCGYLGDTRRECTCSAGLIERYKARLSGPLMDRIDLQVHLHSINYDDLVDNNVFESSKNIQERVSIAHEKQLERFKDSSTFFNSQMTNKELEQFCTIDAAGGKLLKNAMDKFALSARSYTKVIKTARTIADMDDSAEIKTKHVAEALQYRIMTL